MSPLCALGALAIMCAICQKPDDEIRLIEPSWAAPLGGDNGPISFHQGRVVIGTMSKDGMQGEIRCFEAKNGDLLWSKGRERLSQRAQDDRGQGIRSHLSIHGRSVIVYTNRGELMCLDLYGFEDGQDNGIQDKQRGEKDADLIWNVDLPKEFGVFKRDFLEEGGPIPGHVVAGDLVISATGNATTFDAERFLPQLPRIPSPDAPAIVAVSLSSGKVAWTNADGCRDLQFPASGPPTLLPDGKHFAIVGGDSVLRLVELASGKTVRKTEGEVNWSWVAPMATNKQLILYTSRPPSTVGSMRHRIISLAQSEHLETERTPTRQWTFEDKDFTGTRIPPLLSEGVLYVLSDSGMLFAIAAGTGELLWKSSIDLAGPVPHEMLLYKNFLMVPEGSELCIYDLSKKGQSKKIELNIKHIIFNGMAIGDGRLFVADQAFLYSFDLDEVLRL
jgi:outer membrane protein assembly factor BamB